MLIKKLFVVVVLVVFSVRGYSEAYYVSPEGDNDNPGTLEQPWAGFHKAAEKARAGDTVCFRGGIYKIRSQVEFNHSGKPGKWITFMGYPGEIPVINAFKHKLQSKSERNLGALQIHGQEYLRFKGIKVMYSRNGGFEFRNCSHIEVLGNYTFNTYNSGIAFRSSDHILVKGNYVARPNSKDMVYEYAQKKPVHEGITIGSCSHYEVAYNEVCYGDKEGIDNKGSNSYGRVHHNIVHHQQNHPFSVGIYVDAWSDSLYNLEIDHNTIYSCGDGVQVQSEDSQPVDSVVVHHNLIYDMHWSGISTWNAGNNEHITQNIHFYNNTVHNTKDGFYTSGHHTRDIYVRNNIFSQIRGNNVTFNNSQDLAPEEQNFVFEYNIFYGLEDTFGEHCIKENPRFVNQERHDFHLKGNSPAIDAGHPAIQFNDPDGSRNDIGFYPHGKYMSLNKYFVEFSQEGGNQALYINTNAGTPSVHENISWIKTSLNNNNLLKITTHRNKTGGMRKGTITIKTGTFSHTLTVLQNPEYEGKQVVIKE